MRIGVVSDTHDNLPNVARIAAIFRAAGIERVIHTGDITRPETLLALGGAGVPIVGVYGNNDRDRAGLAAAAASIGAQILEPPLELVWAERRIAVVHDRSRHAESLARSHHVTLFGHEHRLTLAREPERLVFNPGECAGLLEGRNAIGVVDLASLEAELLRF